MRSLIRRWGIAVSALLVAALAGGYGLNSRLLSAQGLEVLDVDSKKPVQRALAELKSFLIDKPLTVGVEGIDGYEEQALIRAIDMWQDALIDSPFVLASPHEKPDVIVRFVDEIEGEPSLQGQIHMDRRFFWSKNRHSYRVTAEMLVRDQFRGRRISREELASVIAHELGHLFGLNDVSDPGYLMGPFMSGRSTATLTKAEIDTLRTYRQVLKDKIRALER